MFIIQRVWTNRQNMQLKFTKLEFFNLRIEKIIFQVNSDSKTKVKIQEQILINLSKPGQKRNSEICIDSKMLALEFPNQLN